MKIVILGASGKTGRELVGQALDAGHEVTAVVRSPEKMDIKHPKLKVMQGDAKDSISLERVFAGNQAVLSAVGSTPKHPDYHLMHGTAEAIDRASRATGLRRVVILTSFVALPERLSFIVRQATKLGLGKIITDTQAMKRYLAATDLHWTVVHATRLTNKPETGNVHVVPAGKRVGASDSIARADVASFMLGELDDRKFAKRSVLITGGKL